VHEIVDTLHASAWVARLMPPFLALAVLAFKWRTSSHRVALAVLGTVLCFGVQGIIGQVLIELPVNMPSGTDDLNQALLRVFLVNGWRNVTLSAICDIPLLLWLHSTSRDSSPKP
jgi:heme A synthase